MNELDFIRNNLEMTSKEIGLILGKTTKAVSKKIWEMGLTRHGVTNRPGIKSSFSDADLDFLRANVSTMTNTELAMHLDKSCTVVRNQIYLMGLGRMRRPHFWTQEQTQFLLDNYQEIGDVRLGELLTEKFADAKRVFNRRIVRKKREVLGIRRTEEEFKAIMNSDDNRARCNTVVKNSGSLNYHPGWVASVLATKNHPEMIEVYKANPDLIELKTAQLKLNKELKNLTNDNSKHRGT